MKTKQIIIVTDGDEKAQKAVEESSKDLGLRVISKSAGNPCSRSGGQILDMIEECPDDPIVVMFDDQGDPGYGQGEQAMNKITNSPNTEVLGILAVASDTKEVRGVSPDFCITAEGEIVDGPVDKQGKAEQKGHTILEGDTVDVINEFDDLTIVGIGDIGKMKGKDNCEFGAPITSKALKEILKRSGVRNADK